MTTIAPVAPPTPTTAPGPAPGRRRHPAAVARSAAVAASLLACLLTLASLTTSEAAAAAAAAGMGPADRLWWYLARATGLTAWWLLCIAVFWGLLLSTRALGDRPRTAWLLDLHRMLGPRPRDGPRRRAACRAGPAVLVSRGRVRHLPRQTGLRSGAAGRRRPHAGRDRRGGRADLPGPPPGRRCGDQPRRDLSQPVLSMMSSMRPAMSRSFSVTPPAECVTSRNVTSV
jgi:hypothetical protein